MVKYSSGRLEQYKKDSLIGAVASMTGLLLVYVAFGYFLERHELVFQLGIRLLVFEPTSFILMFLVLLMSNFFLLTISASFLAQYFRASKELLTFKEKRKKGSRRKK